MRRHKENNMYLFLRYGGGNKEAQTVEYMKNPEQREFCELYLHYGGSGRPWKFQYLKRRKDWSRYCAAGQNPPNTDEIIYTKENYHQELGMRNMNGVMDFTEQQKINKFNKKLFPGILLEAVLLTLVFGVGTEEMIHILTKGHAPVMFVALTGGSILLWLLLERWQRFGVPVGVACFVCAAALFMVLHTHVQNGMTGLWNQTVEVLGSKAGIYLTQYTVSEENMANDQFIFWMLLALVTGLVAFAVLRLRLRFITILWSMGFPVLIFMLNIQPGRVKLAVFYLASFLLVNWMHSERNTGQNFVENTAVFLAGAILVCLTVAVSGGVFRMIVPQEQYQSSELVANARTEFLDQTDTSSRQEK